MDTMIYVNNIGALIVTYGENENEELEDKDNYFNRLQDAIGEAYGQLIIMGDLNDPVGNNNGVLERILRKEGEKTVNENEDRIIEIFIDIDLVITNSMFKHRDIHK